MKSMAATFVNKLVLAPTPKMRPGNIIRSTTAHNKQKGQTQIKS